MIFPKDYPCTIPYEIRDQHVYVPGKTRHGKSTMLFHLILGDIQNWGGVTVLDPKGKLVKKLLDYIPEHRKDDTYFLDLKNPIPLDVMSYQGEDEKESLVSELKYIVTKADPSLKRADALLTRLFYMLLSVPFATFLDTHDFFMDEDRKQTILDYLEKSEPDKFNYWTDHFPRPDVYEPIITRMVKFIENPSIRRIFQHSTNPLSIPWVMDNRKVLLVDLGGGGESKSIYGSLLVAKFLQAALRRTHLEDHQIIPHFLYVDEFENFQTSAFDEIFSVAGGLGLKLTVGNQFIGQLDEKIRRSLFGNAGSFIVFKIGEDTNQFKHICQPHDHNLLGSIPKYQAMYKIGDQDPIFKWTNDYPKQPDVTYAQYIKKRTVDSFPFQTEPKMVQLENAPDPAEGSRTLMVDRPTESRPRTRRTK